MNRTDVQTHAMTPFLNPHSPTHTYSPSTMRRTYTQLHPHSLTHTHTHTQAIDWSLKRELGWASPSRPLPSVPGHWLMVPHTPPCVMVTSLHRDRWREVGGGPEINDLVMECVYNVHEKVSGGCVCVCVCVCVRACV